MIIVRIWEGLGNQLFQYAYARALQLRNGEKVCLDRNRIYKEVLEAKGLNRPYSLDKFNIKLPVADGIDQYYFFLEKKNIFQAALYELSQRNILVPEFYKEKDISYKKNLKTVKGNKYLMGWFQNEKYFYDYRSLLLRELTPKKKIKISKRLREVLEERETVSVHIRRTDFKKANNTLPVAYYARAKQYIESKISEPYYIVFSDDITWAKNNLNFDKNVIYISDSGKEKLEDYEELLLMSKCDHNIIANSTFSWWGAWLNNNSEKIVIGPRIWFNSCEKASQYNIMPKEWVKI